MTSYENERKEVEESLKKVVDSGGIESATDFVEKLENFGRKFDAARKAEATHCFCGNEIPEEERTQQEVSPSMYYFNRRTCSTICHNKWILGQFDADRERSGPVGKGWIPIIDQLDKDITELDPDYSIDQVKEKMGGLRYYASFEEPELPLGITNEEVWAIGRVTSDLYHELQKIDDPEGWFGEGVEFEEVPEWKEKKLRKDYANLKSLIGKLQPIQKLIGDAEALSYKTCEWCGSPGSMDNTQGWLLTLCEGCKAKRSEGKRPWDDNFEA